MVSATTFMPVPAHSRAGQLAARRLSNTTQRGRSWGSRYICFSPTSGSVMPATAVNSAPDNVVGTAMCGAFGALTSGRGRPRWIR
jgi:hypothetical protein